MGRAVEENIFVVNPVTTFLTNRFSYLKKRGVDQLEVALKSGFNSANNISMMKSGRSKLPIGRVVALANAIEVDPGKLVLMTLKTYTPDVVDALRSTDLLIETDAEKEILQAVRQLKSEGFKIKTSPEIIEQLKAHLRDTLPK